MHLIDAQFYVIKAASMDNYISFTYSLCKYFMKSLGI